MAEDMSIRSSRQMAVTLKTSNLRVRSDSQTLIKVLTNRAMIKEIFGVVADIKHLSSMFSYISFDFIPWSENTDLGLNSQMDHIG